MNLERAMQIWERVMRRYKPKELFMIEDQKLMEEVLLSDFYFFPLDHIPLEIYDIISMKKDFTKYKTPALWIEIAYISPEGKENNVWIPLSVKNLVKNKTTISEVMSRCRKIVYTDIRKWKEQKIGSRDTKNYEVDHITDFSIFVRDFFKDKEVNLFSLIQFKKAHYDYYIEDDRLQLLTKYQHKIKTEKRKALLPYNSFRITPFEQLPATEKEGYEHNLQHGKYSGMNYTVLLYHDYDYCDFVLKNGGSKYTHFKDWLKRLVQL